MNSLEDHAAFKFGKGAGDLKHELFRPAWSRRSIAGPGTDRRRSRLNDQVERIRIENCRPETLYDPAADDSTLAIQGTMMFEVETGCRSSGGKSCQLEKTFQ
jgi:hypothetical protein